MTIRIRPAVSADIPILRTLIDASVRGLQTRDYTPSQIESALATVYGVDTQLIADGTYFVAEEESSVVAGDPPAQPPGAAPLTVGCGGWSKRKTLYGGDQWPRLLRALPVSKWAQPSQECCSTRLAAMWLWKISRSRWQTANRYRLSAWKSG